MPKPFRCIVAIPTRALFQGEVYYAKVPGSEGDYGVMADHELTVTTNRPGVLTLWLDPEGTKKKYFVTYGGFAQTLYCIRKIEEHCQSGRIHTVARIATLFCGT